MPKCTKISIIILLAVLLQGCSAGVRDNPFFDRDCPIAQPCVMERDTAIIPIRDYFPKIKLVDNVSSRDYHIVPMSRGKDTVMVVRTSASQSLSTIEVESGGEVGSIVLQRPLKTATVPFITTIGCDGQGGRFTVKVKNTPASYLVLWQNTLLGPSSVSYKGEGEFVVKIPGNASGMERSFIRVYASNGNGGIGNSILVPLRNGMVVSDPSLLGSGEKCSDKKVF